MARSLCVNVPAEVSAGVGRVGQARVRIRVNGTEFETLMLSGPNTSHFIKFSAALRKAAGVQSNQNVTVQLRLSEEEPHFEPPDDLRIALEAHLMAKTRWDQLPYHQKKGHADYVAQAGRPEARARRVYRVMDALSF